MADRENHIWGTIRVQLSDVQNYLLNGQYKEAVILDKEILELLVRMQIDKALMVSTNLEGDINQLFEGRVISAQARDAYHGIRAFGELAELGKETSAQDANDSFSMLRDALSSYVDESQGARERRSESNPQQESSPGYGEEGIRINPNSYGEEAPRLRTEGYGDRRTYSPVRESDDEGGLVIPIRRNSGRTSSIHQKERAVPRNGSVKRRVGNRNSSVKRKGRKSSGKGTDVESLMKIGLLVACLLVAVLIIRALAFSKKKTVVETTAALTTEAETTVAPETESSTEESTEAAKRYFVTTGVRVRTKPDTANSEVLTVLDEGSEIDYKGDYNNEWVKINYNGQEAYIAKQYVRSEEIETTASSGQTSANQSISGSSGASNRDGSTTLTVAP